MLPTLLAGLIRRKLAPHIYHLFLAAIWLCAAAPALAAGSGERLLALTFDDLPFVDNGYENTRLYQQRMQRLINTLRASEIPAVGFVNELRLYRGGKVDEAMQGVLESWLDAGLELGNHTFSHSSLHALPVNKFETEIIDGERLTRQLVERHGARLKYFRHPYLHVGLDAQMRQGAEQLLERLNYQVAPVTINISDWSFAAAYEKVEDSGNQQLKDKLLKAYFTHITEAIDYADKLSHELFGRSIRHIVGLHANTLNANNFDAIANHIRQHGYRFISVDEALRDQAYSSLDTYYGPRGESWLYHWSESVGLHPVDEPRVPNFVKRLAGPSAYQK